MLSDATTCADQALAAYSREEEMDTHAANAFGGQTGVKFLK